MSYKDLEIEMCYETSSEKYELLEKFYIPMLSKTVRYYRIAGYFSSTALLVASKGIEELVNNDGVMRLLISPEISEQDYNVLKSNTNGTLDESMDLFSDFNINMFDEHDNLKLLAWLLANKKLEIKVVVDKRSRKSIFHQKIGIGFDKTGNMISFSGSINETAQAWLDNIEEFKTFKSWESGQASYFLNDLQKFNDYWNNEKQEIAQVYDVPTSIKEEIIKKSPANIYDLSIMRKYQKEKKKYSLSLFPHQVSAIEEWKNNDYSLLMEMATGTGKTRTAIGAFCELLNENKKILIIVATPQNTLSRQWKTDIDGLGIKLDKSLIIDGSNTKWKRDLELILIDFALNNVENAIIYTTHATSSKNDFIDIVKKNKFNTEILFICDEVHAIGSGKQRNALLELYDYRIGLSATPDRMFDESGTSIIKKYFGNKSFEFTIYHALHTINPLTGKPFLNKFIYHPRFVFLNEDEMKQYRNLSKKIALAYEDEDEREEVEKLLMYRSRIIKDAENKICELSLIIDELNEELGRIKDTIIFASDEQILTAIETLTFKNISRSKITENESATKIVSGNDTERQKIIKDFRKGEIQVLLGIKCLDEGIDIPNARIAIIMASSINPREYVQRVGRVIRQAPNKQPSVIYDLIVLPDVFETQSDYNLLEKEARRALYIAKNAINYQEVKKCFEMKGVNVECLLVKK